MTPHIPIVSVASILGDWTATLLLPYAGAISAAVILTLMAYATRDKH